MKSRGTSVFDAKVTGLAFASKVDGTWSEATSPDIVHAYLAFLAEPFCLQAMDTVRQHLKNGVPVLEQIARVEPRNPLKSAPEDRDRWYNA